MLESLKKIIPKDKTVRVVWLSMIAIAFLAGWIISNGESTPDLAKHNHEKEETATSWTCSMHPQIQQPKPGQCPICGMDLIPVTSQKSDQMGFREIALSDRARRLANIQVAPVERKFVAAEIRMVGKIEYDETRLGYITARVPGRIDRMYVDYTGITVRKGDHLVELYSPELVSTQQELIQTARSAKESDLEIMKQNMASIRERLRLWGLTPEQINTIESSNKVTDHVTIFAPMGGIVIQRNGLEGMYVNTGTRIYTIADLSRVWLQLDAYESDVPWIRYGQQVEFQTATYPGEIFKGKIAFIDPILNDKTRTIKVRINVDNGEGRLKPGMFAHAIIKSKVAAGGKVMDPNLVGKWISPMHPEIVKDKPGTCDVCGMALVRAEELGYVSAGAIAKQAGLVIPASAPLITGKRAVVYVQVTGREGVYEGREVLLGPRAGDYYIVKEGLQEGEIVVVNGNFKIDSAIQILAKPSMMNPEGGAAPTAHNHGGGIGTSTQTPTHDNHEEQGSTLNLSSDFLKQLDPVYTEYFAIQYALSHDQLPEANLSAKKLQSSLRGVDHNQLSKIAHDVWIEKLIQIRNAGMGIEKAKTLEESRVSFEKLSDVMVTLAKRFGSSGKQPILLYHCPMAFDFKGADWLQNKEGTENPYFGSKMFKCGTQEAVITKGDLESSGGHQHE
jgi:Cu(I)/Ag(I) efflux system membrane fusion protein